MSEIDLNNRTQVPHQPEILQYRVGPGAGTQIVHIALVDAAVIDAFAKEMRVTLVPKDIVGKFLASCFIQTIIAPVQPQQG